MPIPMTHSALSLLPVGEVLVSTERLKAQLARWHEAETVRKVTEALEGPKKVAPDGLMDTMRYAYELMEKTTGMTVIRPESVALINTVA